MPDRTIGRYQLLSELGRGANGVVWRARHTLLPDRVVALKVLSESLWDSDQARRRFLQEAIAVSRLDHPSIATLYDAEEVEGQLYIAFKLIDGKTVAKQTAAGPLSVERAVSIARDAAEGLAHAHEHGVIHRDVSAGNVMVAESGRGVLVDFGLARSGQSLTQTTGAIVGTLPFMAPEVLRGKAADARSDIYSLGAVLYRMLTGRAPFEGDQPEEVVYGILNHRPKPPSQLRPGVAADLDDVVLRALERDPRDRYSSAREMARALRDAFGAPSDDSTWNTSGKKGVFSSIRRATRRRSFRWSAGTAAVALVTVAGLGAAWSRGWRPWPMNRAPVVAVIPIRNMSEDQVSTSYLGEAFGQDLVDRLGRVSHLRLIPWLTSERFTDRKQGFEAVGRELRADKLVVGSYRSDGERIKINIAVVDVASGLQNWSQDYDQNLDGNGLMSLQGAMAGAIASKLRGNLSDQERRALGAAPSRNPVAYEYYLHGADALNSQDPKQIVIAEPFFRKAIELDSTLAEAWVGLGAVKSDLYFRGQGDQAYLGHAEMAFRTALRLDSTLYVARRGLMQVYSERGQRDALLALGRMPLRSDEDVEGLLARAWAYSFGGLHDQAVPLLDRVLDLDPGNQGAAWFRVIDECWSGNIVLAAEHARRYMRKFPEDPEMWTWLGVSLYGLGQPAEAKLCLSRALELFGEGQSNLYSVLYAASLYRQAGEKARADSLVGHWREVVESRLATYPDNRRLRETQADLMAFSEGPERARFAERFVSDWEHGRGIPGDIEDLFIMDDIPKMRRLCLVFARRDLADDHEIVHSGVLRLLLASRYESISQLPEFRALLAAVDKRHAELVARYKSG